MYHTLSDICNHSPSYNETFLINFVLCLFFSWVSTAFKQLLLNVPYTESIIFMLCSSYMVPFCNKPLPSFLFLTFNLLL